MKKSDRQKVFEKFGGRCAYSGKELPDDWQVDHVTHKRSVHWLILMSKGEKVDVNHTDNLFPSLKILNHYKRGLDLEGWRQYLLNLHIRLKKMPKNPKSGKGIKYKAYMQQVSESMGITAEAPFSGIFYFETLNNQP